MDLGRGRGACVGSVGPKWDERTADSALVFTGPRGGRVDAHNLRARVVKPAAVTVGLGEWIKTPRERRVSSRVSLHTFRHTCATRLFAAGWTIVHVPRWLGHHKASFTLDTYAHLLPGDLPDEPPAVEGNARATRGQPTRPTETTRSPRDALE